MKEFFKKTAIGISLTAALMSSAMPAMAEDCSPEDKAKITRVEHSSLRVLDFSKSSQACLEEFGNKVSRKYLTLVAESDSQNWREATVEAARQLHEEGKRVVVAYANDRDGLDYTANTTVWANGVERGFVPVRITDGLRIDHIGDIQHSPAQKAIAMMREEGSQVWDKYLKVPAIAMN